MFETYNYYDLNNLGGRDLLRFVATTNVVLKNKIDVTTYPSLSSVIPGRGIISTVVTLCLTLVI